MPTAAPPPAPPTPPPARPRPAAHALLPGAALPCVLDVEASGFGRGSFPIEVGYVLPDGSSYCTLIQPAPQWTHWDDQAEQLHGISRSLLASHGRPAVEVARALNSGLAGQTVYCDGWAHDYTWLALLFDEAGLQPHFQLRHLHELLADRDAARWDAACAGVRSRLALERHRASGDARVLQLALAELGCVSPAAPRRSDLR